MLPRLTHVIAGVTTIALLNACTSQASTPTTPLAQQNQPRTGKPATSSCPCLYVTNGFGGPSGKGSVTVYPASATGNAKPIQAIAGSRTGLDRPSAIALDASGDIYVTNYATQSVTVYAAVATGNAKPMQTISGSNTALDDPEGITVDPTNGDIYVTNQLGAPSGIGSVTIYGPHSNGNVPPIGTIAGESTGLSSPVELALDSSDNVCVPNYDNASVTVYAAGSVGNIAPMRTISGDKTGLDAPFSVAFDADANMYVVNFASGTVTLYAAGANGNAKPIRTIKGGKAKLEEPTGIALDASGKPYVADAYTNWITVYAADANGRVARSWMRDRLHHYHVWYGACALSLQSLRRRVRDSRRFPACGSG